MRIRTVNSYLPLTDRWVVHTSENVNKHTHEVNTSVSEDYLPPDFNTSKIILVGGVIEDRINAKVAIDPKSANHRKVRLKNSGFAGGPCHHVKVARFFNNSPLILKSVDENDDRTITNTDSYSAQSALISIGGVPTINEAWQNTFPLYGSFDAYADPDWTALKSSFSEALNSFAPAKFFVIEDLVENAEVLLNFRKLLFHPQSSIRKFIRMGVKNFKGSDTLGRIHKAVQVSSSSYLGYQFGIRPTIQDIGVVARMQEIASRRFRYLLLNRGRWVPVRARQQLLSTIEVLHPSPDDGRFVFRQPAFRRLTASCTCLARVRRDINYANMEDIIRATMSGRKIIQSVWELIPFSFVVDWFTNLQERVQTLAGNEESPYCETGALYWTVKKETATDVRVNLDASYTTAPASYQIYRKIESDYSRSISEPTGGSLSGIVRLQFYQAVTSGALVLQRLR